MALQFTSRVGQVPTFFVPRGGDDDLPTATLSGPTGEFDVAVAEAPAHSDFGERWQLTLPEPFWAVGDYVITVSSGEVYEITVEKHRGTMRPAEAARFGRLSPDDQVAALALAAASREEV